MAGRPHTRRKILKTLGVGASVGLAGCSNKSESAAGSPTLASTHTTSTTTGDSSKRTKETTPEGEALRPTRVVEREGPDFVLGDDRYVFSGVANCCLAEGYTSRARVDSVLESAARLDTDVIRFKVGAAGGSSTCESTVNGCTLSFQPRPGEFNETAFEHLDYVLAKAGERGIRVILPLVDNWGDNGMHRYVEWAGGDEATEFYELDEAQSLYRAFVAEVLTRTNTITGREYRSDPTVLLWELANEPRGHADGELLRSWVEDTAAFIADHDVAQLVSTGSDIYPEKLYTEVHAVDGIDACSIHLWPQNWDEPKPAAFGANYIADRVELGHETVGKPVYLGEYGWRVNLQAADVERQLARRNELFAHWHDAALSADVDGLLAWELLSDDRLAFHQTESGQGETVGFACPEHEATCDILRSVAHRIEQRATDRETKNTDTVRLHTD